jgi:hypothetical protein
VPGWNLRLWRRVRVAPGVTINLSKSGPSVSVGPRGAKMTFGHGRVRQTLGIPGTGLYATRTLPSASTASAAETAAAPSATEPDVATAVEPGPPVPAAPIEPSTTDLHFGWPLIIAVAAGVIAGYGGATASASVLVAGVTFVGCLLYEWMAHHHPVALRLVVHAVIGVAAVAAALFVGFAIALLGVALLGGGTSRRRR